MQDEPASPEEPAAPPPASRWRSAVLYLRRRLRGAARQITPGAGPVLDVGIEAPPQSVGSPLWSFWLWLIDERLPTLDHPQRTPGGMAWWRLRVHLDPRPARDPAARSRWRRKSAAA